MSLIITAITISILNGIKCSGRQPRYRGILDTQASPLGKYIVFVYLIPLKHRRAVLADEIKTCMHHFLSLYNNYLYTNNASDIENK